MCAFQFRRNGRFLVNASGAMLPYAVEKETMLPYPVVAEATLHYPAKNLTSWGYCRGAARRGKPRLHFDRLID